MLVLLSDFLARLAEGEIRALLWVALIYAALMSSVSLIFAFRVRGWPVTQGVLNVADVVALENMGQDRTHAARVAYAYDVGGRTYTGRRLSPLTLQSSGPLLVQRQLDGIERLQGGRVRVYYNPNRPEKSYLLRPNGRTLLLVVGLSLATLIMLGAALMTM